MCIKCKVTSHTSHNVVTVANKCKALKRELDHFHGKRKKKIRRQLNKCSEKVKEAIHRQYCNVKQWLFEAYQKQVSEIDNIVNVKFEKHLHEQGDLKRFAELCSNYSHSSTFLLESKEVLEQLKSNPSNPELIWPTYKAPKEQFMGFSEEFITLGENLFGKCDFQNEKIGFEKKMNFDFPSRKLIRSQSLVEIPTFTKLSQKPLSQKSSSLKSFYPNSQEPSTHQSATRAELEDQCITEVCHASSI